MKIYPPCLINRHPDQITRGGRRADGRYVGEHSPVGLLETTRHSITALTRSAQDDLLELSPQALAQRTVGNYHHDHAHPGVLPRVSSDLATGFIITFASRH